MSKPQQKKRKPMPKWFFGVLALLLSFLFHLDLIYELANKREKDSTKQTSSIPKGYIKLDVPKKTKAEEKKQEDEDLAKRILEAPLAPTESPDDAEFLGQTNHKAKKRMKAKPHEHPPAVDPGMPKTLAKKSSKMSTPTKQELGKDSKTSKRSSEKDQNLAKHGLNKDVERMKAEARNGYENLLANSMESVSGQEHQGYMDHLDDLVEEGETIDMNTKEYRFIGYFTGLRKAIELVWVYPSEAAHRGLHGEVIVKFIIMTDGKVSKVQVLESSGYSILDTAIVDAIRAAAPFAPLPKGFHKDRLILKGAFSYILGNY